MAEPSHYGRGEEEDEEEEEVDETVRSFSVLISVLAEGV